MMGESISNRMNEKENRISRLDDKVIELDPSSKDYEKNFKTWEGICRKCGAP